MSTSPSLAIFCKVVDNYGDIGICWRLARQLHGEHGVAVTLWVDDLASFRRICPEVDAAAAAQTVAGVAVRHWRGQDDAFAPAEVADIVIEFFACDIPPRYVEAMAARTPRPVWLNLEGLTAEEWVEGCHKLPSMHPRLKLTKHFFFPGFTARTGGLLREAGLERERLAFLAQPERAHAFLQGLGLADAEIDAYKVSLFCYPHAPVAELFAAWQGGARKVTCLVPEGVAADAVAAFLGTEASAGTVATRGMLTVRALPFVPQPDYDRLLWSCDLNLVRGEDSWVRAQWAGKPFVWHIYPQDENLHHKKLRAFLERYAPDLASLNEFMLHWNGAAAANADWPALWSALQADEAAIAVRAGTWQREMTANGDLASNLLAFATQIAASLR
ncbi:MULTISPECIES: elongation factor P maturation arginine rhamnosyltransferase EarP [unclassified Massilia]|uniref:elongation factor P maturation arginine rhamnosyltransferase EarP n=1 Tax=unclassified Massilia TaxID=2609279 RepID=UPI0017841901|nr:MULTISPECIES: elongation factor P maturation arginine rhamnosyltransferase EarP [unclassified Massilia]MBD8530459.1 elongation factor P maturation arginine rhamnosyltransferase EarP [Massilia sp. CFBP 13647]MBD8674243.1 elongation factor P maturation arginine rhamnosyltransferase EarP [Massilia sp. CFBP 13721]